MKQPLIVVTGAPNSGKTEFSYRIAQILSYRHINIGSELLQHLNTIGIKVDSRNEIGPKFFEHASFKDYLAVIKSKAAYGVVLDGIRFVKAVEVLRQLYDDLIHVHRIQPDSSLDLSSVDIYGDHLHLLEGIADFRVGWKEPVKALDGEIRKIFGSIVEDL